MKKVYSYSHVNIEVNVTLGLLNNGYLRDEPY